MKYDIPRLFKGQCKCGESIEMLVQWQWQITHKAQQFCKSCGNFTPITFLEEVKV
jgi:hypothetical protein